MSWLWINELCSVLTNWLRPGYHLSLTTLPSDSPVIMFLNSSNCICPSPLLSTSLIISSMASTLYSSLKANTLISSFLSIEPFLSESKALKASCNLFIEFRSSYFIAAATNSPNSIVPLLSRSALLYSSSTSSSVRPSPKNSLWPARNSSFERLPVWSVSRALNTCRKSSRSFLDTSCWEIKEKVAFFRFDSDWNYLRLVRASLMPTVDFYLSLWIISLSQTCSRACEAVILLAGSITSNFLIKSFAFSETLFQALLLKLYYPVCTVSIISFSF